MGSVAWGYLVFCWALTEVFYIHFSFNLHKIGCSPAWSQRNYNYYTNVQIFLLLSLRLITLFVVFPFRINSFLNLNIIDSRWDSSYGWSARSKTSVQIGQLIHGINADKHPCLEWGPNPRSQCTPYISRPVVSAVFRYCPTIITDTVICFNIKHCRRYLWFIL
jgi:hypothetical protein